MSWSPDQQERLAYESEILRCELPQFRVYNHRGNTYMAGMQGTNGNYREYELTLRLSEEYPYEKPELFVTSPITLWKYDSESTINEEGLSHDFHTRSNGPDGCVQICHFKDWNSSNTCVAVFLKGILWLQAYEFHLCTGDDIEVFFRQPRY